MNLENEFENNTAMCARSFYRRAIVLIPFVL